VFIFLFSRRHSIQQTCLNRNVDLCLRGEKRESLLTSEKRNKNREKSSENLSFSLSDFDHKQKTKANSQFVSILQNMQSTTAGNEMMATAFGENLFL